MACDDCQAAFCWRCSKPDVVRAKLDVSSCGACRVVGEAWEVGYLGRFLRARRGELDAPERPRTAAAGCAAGRAPASGDLECDLLCEEGGLDCEEGPCPDSVRATWSYVAGTGDGPRGALGALAEADEALTKRPGLLTQETEPLDPPVAGAPAYRPALASNPDASPTSGRLAATFRTEHEDDDALVCEILDSSGGSGGRGLRGDAGLLAYPTSAGGRFLALVREARLTFAATVGRGGGASSGRASPGHAQRAQRAARGWLGRTTPYSPGPPPPPSQSTPPGRIGLRAMHQTTQRGDLGHRHGGAGGRRKSSNNFAVLFSGGEGPPPACAGRHTSHAAYPGSASMRERAAGPSLRGGQGIVSQSYVEGTAGCRHPHLGDGLGEGAEVEMAEGWAEAEIPMPFASASDLARMNLSGTESGLSLFNKTSAWGSRREGPGGARGPPQPAGQPWGVEDVEEAWPPRQ